MRVLLATFLLLLPAGELAAQDASGRDHSGIICKGDTPGIGRQREDPHRPFC